MTKEEQGEKAFNLHTQIATNEKTRRGLLSLNCELITEMIDEKLYKHYLGDPSAPLTAYLAALDVFYSRSQVNRFRKINKVFKTLGIDIKEVWDIPDSRLSDIVNNATAENVNDLLDKARILIPSDWNTEMRKLKNLPNEDDCEDHDFKVFHECIRCGKKTK